MRDEDTTLSVTAFPALFESAPDAIVIVDGQGQIVLMNTQAERITGYAQSELVNRQSEILVPLRFRQRHRKYLANLINDPKFKASAATLELYGLRKSGEEFPAEISLTPVQTEHGLLVCSVIRERHAKIEELRASEVRFRRLFETAKDAVLLLDATTGQVRDVNRFLIELLGYSPEEFLGKRLWETGPFKNNYSIQAAFQELRQKPYIRYEDLPLLTKTGTAINAELIGNIYRVNKDRVIQCVIRDITERKRAESALRQSEERYRSIFDNDVAGDYISTPDGKLLACNLSFVRMFGFISIEEAKDAGIKSLYPDIDAYEEFIRLLTTKKTLVGREEELRRKDGTTLHVVTRVIGVFDQAQELVEIHAYLIDESERRRNEQQIRQAQKMDAMGRLAGGVAHDFNNLLGIIIGQSEILSDREECVDSVRKGLTEIGNIAHRGAALTRQLLAFTRQQVLEPRILDLNAVVRDTDGMIARLIGENITLVMNLDVSIGHVRADPNQIVQIILNLAVNSRDAMPAGGILTIETSDLDIDDDTACQDPHLRAGQYVALRVIDTGVGMDLKTQSHIFEPFYSTKGIGMGTGLGLATVHGIVTQSDGQISVFSELGRGATFEILLPRIMEEISAISVPLVRKAKGFETILLVEDARDLREVICKFLTIDGYTVLEAEDSKEAVQIATQHEGPIHMILTDVVLPGEGGRIVAEQILRTRPETKVLFMSGYTDDAVLYSQILQAALNFIQKPFTKSDLISRVRHVLDESKVEPMNSVKLISV